MPARHVRATPDPMPTRHQFLNQEFYFDGMADLSAGRWRVRRVIHEKNVYVCTRLTGFGKNIEEFDIGYVMHRVRDEAERVRERGP